MKRLVACAAAMVLLASRVSNAQAGADACDRTRKDVLGGLESALTHQLNHGDAVIGLILDLSRASSPLDARNCAVFLGQKCPDLTAAHSSETNRTCKKSRAISGPRELIWHLSGNNPACEFQSLSGEVVQALDNDPEGQLRWCVYHVRAGGDSTCLVKLKSQVRTELARPADPESDLNGWFGVIADFAHPQYRPLLPWLSSLPEPKNPIVRDSRRLAVAAQTKNRTALLRLIGFHDQYVHPLSVYWYMALFPKRDLIDDLQAIGAKDKAKELEQSNAASIKREVEALKAVPRFYCAAP